MEIIFTKEQFGRNEIAAAEKLYELFVDFFEWNACEGKLMITNYLLPPGYPERDIDLLVLLEISEGSSISLIYNEGKVLIKGGYIFNVEVKDHIIFHSQSGSVFVNYSNGTTKKNATKQAWDIKNNLINYLQKQAIGQIPLISEVLFFPNCSHETTVSIFTKAENIPINFLDHSVSISSLLKCALGENGSLLHYNKTENSIQLAKIREFLTIVKELPKSLSRKFELFAVESFREKSKKLMVGQKEIALVTGSPGSGKTILMLGKALQFAREGKCSLFLTYNKQLVLDLERLQTMIRKFAPDNPFLMLRIETWDSFIAKLYNFYDYFIPLGHKRLDQESKALLISERYKGEKGKLIFENDEKRKSTNIYKYNNASYVFIDEAQDLSQPIFSILKSIYSMNICLALGQLQEYNEILDAGPVETIYLNHILRQKEIPSRVANEFLNISKLNFSYQIIQPTPPELIEGKATVYDGEIDQEFYENICNILQHNGWVNYDFLHLHINEGSSIANTSIGHYNGGDDKENTTLNPDKFRFFHYNSCRGLEANIVLYEKFDSYYEWCINKFGEDSAKKRAFIALTRSKDFSIFTFSDLNHWLYRKVVSRFASISNKMF